MKTLANEIWKKIPRHPMYFASNLGQIRIGQYTVKQKCIDKKYLWVLLKTITGTSYERVHRLILEAFIGPCPNKMETRHLNDTKTDNQLSNLCWGTRKQNLDDRKRNGIEIGFVTYNTKQREKLSKKRIVIMKNNGTSFNGFINKTKEEKRKIFIKIVKTVRERGSLRGLAGVTQAEKELAIKRSIATKKRNGTIGWTSESAKKSWITRRKNLQNAN